MQTTKELFILCEFLRPASQDEIAILREKILHNQIPWVEVVALANRDYLIPALYIALEDKQLLQVIQDEQLINYLKEVYTFNTERNLQILEQLKDIVSILKPLGVTPLFLKGSAVLTEEDYPDVGMRSMTDIDIIVDRAKVEESFEALQVSGYSFVDSERGHRPLDDHHHLEAMQKACMPAALELHIDIVGEEAREYIDNTRENMKKSINKNFKDVDVLLPTYRLYHAFLHSEVQHRNHRGKFLALRHLFDFTVLVHKYYEEIDWKLLHKLSILHHCEHILDDYLYISKILFALETPITIENEKTKHHYAKILKSFELEGTFRGLFYPLVYKIHMYYGYKKLKNIYHFKSFLGYFPALFKHICYQIRAYK